MGNNEVSVSTVNLMPQTFGEKYKMAQILSQSGLIPQGLNTPEKVCVALQWGHELGLSPMVAVNNVAVINGKPTLSADIMGAVVKRSPEYGGIEWIKNSDTEAECKILRILPNGKTESIVSRFTIEDATKAGLAGRDVWRKYPKRMLKHRCLSYGLKDMFPDLLAGLYTPEEMESITPEQPAERNVTPQPEYLSEQIRQEENIADARQTNVQKSSDFKPESFDENTEERKELSDILTKYESALAGVPYNLSCEALANNDPVKISEMLGRCKTYLGKKGIKVA